MIDRNHPAVKAAMTTTLGPPDDNQCWMSRSLTAALPHLTADDLPDRLVRDIQVRTLRAAARAVTYEGGDDPLSRELVQAAVSALLDEFADNIEGEETPNE